VRVVQINATANEGGTGRVCAGLSRILTRSGIENYTLCVSGEAKNPSEIKYAKGFEIKLQALLARIFGNYGFNSRIMTKRLISHLDRIKPNIVHLHNLHGHNANLKMLFEYFKKNPQIKLFWTFHDCWSFTGYCMYYELADCEKWKGKCSKCPQRKAYSWFFDKSTALQVKKKELFDGLDITITTPSQWLAEVVKQTYFANNDIRVIHNGVDMEAFKPTENDFRKERAIQDKHIVLGVAANWTKRKGLEDFIELSRRLPSEYQIVLVGTNDEIDKLLPDSIISIHKTNDKTELAKLYTAADVFVNPTKEEVFGLVNIEALACGTPVVTYNTGGSPECVDENSGIVVPKNDINALESAITHVCRDKPFSKEDCLARAKEFDEKEKFKEYIGLYGDK